MWSVPFARERERVQAPPPSRVLLRVRAAPGPHQTLLPRADAKVNSGKKSPQNLGRPISSEAGCQSRPEGLEPNCGSAAELVSWAGSGPAASRPQCPVSLLQSSGASVCGWWERFYRNTAPPRERGRRSGRGTTSWCGDAQRPLRRRRQGRSRGGR